MYSYTKSEGTGMQFHLYLPQELAVKHDLSLKAVIILTYYALGDWKTDKKVIDGHQCIHVEYHYDIVQKMPLLDLKKRAFDRYMAELERKGLIVKHYFKKQLYIHIDPAIKDEIRIGYKKPNRKVSAFNGDIMSDKDFDIFYEKLCDAYPRKTGFQTVKPIAKKMELHRQGDAVLKALDYYKMTKAVAEGKIYNLENFLKNWENYADGVPKGIAIDDDAVEAYNKNLIINDQAFQEVLVVIYQFCHRAYELSDEGDYVDFREVKLFDSDSKAEILIERFGGIRSIYLNSFSSDFQKDLHRLWVNIR